MPFIAAGHVKKGNPATNRLTYIVGVPAYTVGARMYIAIVTGAGGATFTGPDGWDTVYAGVNLGGNATAAVFSKIAIDAEPATVEVTTTIKDKAVWICWTVTEDDEINAQGVTATGTSATATLPTLTTSVADCLVMGIVFADQSSTPFATPATWTKLDEHAFSSSASIAVYYRTRFLSDVEPSVSVGMGASKPWAGVTFAIAPTVAAVEPWRFSATLTSAAATPSPALLVERTTDATLIANSATPTTIALHVERSTSARLAALGRGNDLVDLGVTNLLRKVATMSGQGATSTAIMLVRYSLVATITPSIATSAANISSARMFAAILSATSQVSAAMIFQIALSMVRGGVEVIMPGAEVTALAPGAEVVTLAPSAIVVAFVPKIVVSEN